MKKFIFSMMFVFGLGMVMSSCGNSTKSADAVASDTDSVVVDSTADTVAVDSIADSTVVK